MADLKVRTTTETYGGRSDFAPRARLHRPQHGGAEERDTVFGTDTGAIDLPPGQDGFASLITFHGETGAAQNATGQIRLRGDFDPVAGITAATYLGTICTP